MPSINAKSLAIALSSSPMSLKAFMSTSLSDAFVSAAKKCLSFLRPDVRTHSVNHSRLLCQNSISQMFHLQNKTLKEILCFFEKNALTIHF